MNKINLVEILKKCPKGMELNCAMYEGLTFVGIELEESNYPILTQLPDGTEKLFTKYGEYDLSPQAKCVIFPKGKTTWEGFVPPCKFKDGDIIYTHANCLDIGLGNTWISIFQECKNGGIATYVDMTEDGDSYYDYIDGSKGLLCMNEDIMRQRLATEEEKQKLFDAIKENGYKWNAETKTLEKLIEPIFKVGDKICRNGIIFEISQINKECYTCHTDESLVTIDFKHQDKYELVPSKFDISTLKPFESRVLARIDNYNLWKPTIFGFWDEDGAYMVGGSFWRQVIPYEGNEKLLGTTDDCDEYYKTWE